MYELSNALRLSNKWGPPQSGANLDSPPLTTSLWFICGLAVSIPTWTLSPILPENPPVCQSDSTGYRFARGEDQVRLKAQR